MDVPTALAAAREVIATISNAHLTLTVGKWVVSRYDLLSFLKNMRSVDPDLTESRLQVLGLLLEAICEQLFLSRFVQICEDMAEAAKGAPPPDEVRTRTVYGIAAAVLQAVSPRLATSAAANTTITSHSYLSWPINSMRPVPRWLIWIAVS